MCKKEIYLFGMNSITRILASYLEDDPSYHLLGITVDGKYCNSNKCYGYPLLPFEDLAQKGGNFSIINCVGYSNQLSVRAKIDKQILAKQIPLLSYYHRSAVINNVDFGEGNLVMNNAIIEPNSIIGNGNVFYGESYICHDAVIGDYNWFAACATLAGEINVGNFNFVGINSSIKEKIKIGTATTIGMGAVVIKDVPNNAVVVGNPASIIRYNEVTKKC